MTRLDRDLSFLYQSIKNWIELDSRLRGRKINIKIKISLLMQEFRYKIIIYDTISKFAYVDFCEIEDANCPRTDNFAHFYARKFVSGYIDHITSQEGQEKKLLGKESGPVYIDESVAIKIDSPMDAVDATAYAYMFAERYNKCFKEDNKMNSAVKSEITVKYEAELNELNRKLREEQEAEAKKAEYEKISEATRLEAVEYAELLKHLKELGFDHDDAMSILLKRIGAK